MVFFLRTVIQIIVCYSSDLVFFSYVIQRLVTVVDMGVSWKSQKLSVWESWKSQEGGVMKVSHIENSSWLWSDPVGARRRRAEALHRRAPLSKCLDWSTTHMPAASCAQLPFGGVNLLIESKIAPPIVGGTNLKFLT